MPSLHFKRIWNSFLSGVDVAVPRARILARPERISIAINDRCNLRCPHCLRRVEGVKVDQNALGVEDLRRLEPWFAYARYVALVGLGEPFLEDNLFDVVDLIHRHGATVSLITNATRIDERAVERLCGSRPTILNLSIDAATPAVFERVRLGARFDAVVENVDRLVRRKREIGATFPILSINMTLMRDTLDEIEGVIDLARRWDVHEVVAQPVMFLPASPDRSQAVTNREAQDALRRAESYARESGVSLRYQPLGQGLEEQEEDRRAGYDFGPDTTYNHGDKVIPGARRFFCPNLWQQMNVDVFGRMVYCCMADFGYLGNIQNSPPADLWNHPHMVALRGRLLDGRVPEDCRRCFALEHYGRRKMLRLWWQDMKSLLKSCVKDWRGMLKDR